MALPCMRRDIDRYTMPSCINLDLDIRITQGAGQSLKSQHDNYSSRPFWGHAYSLYAHLIKIPTVFKIKMHAISGDMLLKNAK